MQAVAALLRADFDVVVLQEIQHGQFRALRKALGAQHARWTFKHWPIKRASEGLGVLSNRPLRVRSRTISSGYWPWQWQRRVVQHITFNGGFKDSFNNAFEHIDDQRVTIANTHLSTFTTERGAQMTKIVARGPQVSVVIGDLNESEGPALEVLRTAGFTDAWHSTRGDEPCLTNWSNEDRSRPPDQQLDWCWVRVPLQATAASVCDWQLTAHLTDHVPLAITIE